METWAYYGSIIVISLGAPWVAGRLSSVRWRYKIPASLVLANVIPPLLYIWLDADGYIGSTFGIAMMFGLMISIWLVLMASAFVMSRAQANG